MPTKLPEDFIFVTYTHHKHHRKDHAPSTTNLYEPIHHFDLKEPQLIRHMENDEAYAMAFHKDGKRYFFSNDEGHTVISDGGTKNRPMSKKEFENVVKLMIDASIKCDTKKRKKYLDEIAKLDFSLGHANATFEVYADLEKPSKINFLAINLGNLRYVYEQETGNVLKVHVDRTSPNGYMLDGPEKNEIINKITSSKTMAKKIAAMPQQ